MEGWVRSRLRLDEFKVLSGRVFAGAQWGTGEAGRSLKVGKACLRLQLPLDGDRRSAPEVGIEMVGDEKMEGWKV